MDNRHRRVAAFALAHQKQRQRFSHNHAPSENHHMRAGDFDSALDEQALTTEWRAWNETALIAERELGDVCRMKAIHVFRRIHRAHDGRFVDLLRWR